MDPELKAEIRRLVDDLVAERYDSLILDGRAGRVSAEGMRRVMHGYPATFVPLLEATPMDLYEIRAEPGCYLVDVSLRSVEEGQSDLVLTVHASPSESGYRVEMVDLYAH